MGWISVLGELVSNANAAKDIVENAKNAGSYVLGEIGEGLVVVVDYMGRAEDKIDEGIANRERKKQGKENESRIKVVESELSNWRYSTPCKYDNIRCDLPFPYYSVKINGKWGMIDGDDNIIIPFEYDYLGIYNEGVVAAKKGDKFGYIDLSNNIVLPFEFGYAKRFRHGLAPVAVIQNEEWQYGYIDIDGKFVIQPQFDYAEPFRENGLAIVGKYSELDSSSKTARYHKGVINTSGRLLLNLRYKELDIYKDYMKGLFEDGIFVRRMFFDINGMPIDECEEKQELIEKNELYLYHNGDLKYGWYTCTEMGENVCKIKPMFQWGTPFNEFGYAAVELNNQFGIIKLAEQ